MQKTNGKLADENKEFNEKVKQLAEEIWELENQMLSAPRIPPRNKKFLSKARFKLKLFYPA